MTDRALPFESHFYKKKGGGGGGEKKNVQRKKKMMVMKVIIMSSILLGISLSVLTRSIMRKTESDELSLYRILE